MWTELLICGNKKTKADTPTHISAYDLHTGSHLYTFKESNSDICCIAITNDFIFAAQNDKPIIKVFNWSSQKQQHKMVVPEKLCSIDATDNWLAGGTESGKLFLWEIASGRLLFCRGIHFRAIVSVGFSRDDLRILTTSLDSRSQVWNLSDLVDIDKHSNDVEAALIFKESSSPSIMGSWGVGNRSYVLSSDGSLIIREEGEILVSFGFSTKATCFCIDPAERAAYVGNEAGEVIFVPFYEGCPTEFVGNSTKMLSAQENESTTFFSIGSMLNTLVMSFDASLLIGGSDDGLVCIWDVASRQIIRKVKDFKYPVTSVLTMISPDSFKQSNSEFTRVIPQFQKSEQKKDEGSLLIKTGNGSFKFVHDIQKDMADLKGTSSADSEPDKLLELSRKLEKKQSELKEMNEKYNKLWQEHIKLRLD